MKNGILKSAGLLFVILFTTGYIMSQSDTELKSKIEKINKDMASAMIANNTDKMLSYYTDDVISMPNNEEMLRGKDALRKMNEDMTKAGWKVKSFETNTTDVKSSGNMIIEIGTFKISFSAPGKTDTMDEKGKYLTVWEKQKDGSLKIKVETWNNSEKPTEKM